MRFDGGNLDSEFFDQDDGRDIENRFELNSRDFYDRCVAKSTLKIKHKN